MSGTLSGIVSGSRRERGRGRRLLRAVAYGVVFAVPVTVAAFLVRAQWDPLISFDKNVIRATTDITRAHPAFREFLIGWEHATTPKVIFSVGTLACVWLGGRHRHLRSRAWWAFLTMMVAWNLQLDLKYIVQRARPLVEDPVWEAPGYSFPSGHAATNAAFATTVVLLLWPVLRPVGRRIALVWAGIHVLVTAGDRLFLGVHYPSDVTAGVILGTGIVVSSYVGYLGWRPVADNDPSPPEGRVGPEPTKEASS